jgi:hypothetical protein
VVFVLLFDPAHRVLLSRFSGAFTLDDIAECDRAVLMALGREGPIRGLIDLSDVETVDISSEQILQRARQPAMVAGQTRIFVATKPAALAFARAYSAAQQEFNGGGPQVVGSLADAYRLLGLVDPAFEPVELA